MRTTLIGCLLLVVTFLTIPAATAASGGNSEAAKRCQSDYTALGFRNVGQCVSHHARGGGTVVSGPATLTVTFDRGLCADNTGQVCVWSVQGSGLRPGSEVIVGGADVTYGATVIVRPDGTVSTQPLFHLGSCVVSGYENTSFVARGVAADGTPVASPIVAANYTTYVPICET